MSIDNELSEFFERVVRKGAVDDEITPAEARVKTQRCPIVWMHQLGQLIDDTFFDSVECIRGAAQAKMHGESETPFGRNLVASTLVRHTEYPVDDRSTRLGAWITEIENPMKVCGLEDGRDVCLTEKK